MIPFIAGLILLYLFLLFPRTSKRREMMEFSKGLFAHRGLHDPTGQAPENSLNAFERAVGAGYGIELDVQLSKDEVAVVFHDALLARIARDRDGLPVPGKVQDYTYDELRQFHLLQSDQRIPQFSEVLNVINGEVKLICEIKTDRPDQIEKTCRKAQELLDRYNGAYCVESFDPRAVLWYRRNRPEILRGQLSEHFTIGGTAFYRACLWANRKLLFNAMTKPDFIAYNRRDRNEISRRLCRLLFRHPSVAWTVQSKEQLLECVGEYDGFIFDSFVPDETILRRIGMSSVSKK